MQILKPKEIIEEISNLKTGEKYKNDEEWKARKPYGTHDKTSCKKIRNHANQS